MSSHRIRLRGPWEYAALSRTTVAPDGALVGKPGPLPPPGRTQAPADWDSLFGPDFRGRAALRRVFHRPTGLEGGERVWLVIESGLPVASVRVNDHPLPASGAGTAPYSADLTELLQPQNELVVEIDFPPGQGPAEAPTVLDDVFLEIRPRGAAPSA